MPSKTKSIKNEFKNKYYIITHMEIEGLERKYYLKQLRNDLKILKPNKKIRGEYRGVKWMIWRDLREYYLCGFINVDEKYFPEAIHIVDKHCLGAVGCAYSQYYTLGFNTLYDDRIYAGNYNGRFRISRCSVESTFITVNDLYENIINIIDKVLAIDKNASSLNKQWPIYNIVPPLNRIILKKMNLKTNIT